MKASWARQHLNSFQFNSVFNLVGKRQLHLHNNNNGCPRFIFKVKTFASGISWRSPLKSQTNLAENLAPSQLSVFARKLHSSNNLAKEEKKPETLQELIEATEKQETSVTVGQKVAQAGKDVSYFAIILAGFAVTGALLWYVCSELFLSSSPNKIYANALKKVKQNDEVIEAIGRSIKAYGEETSRGRRRHVSYQEYIVNGENYMRVKFYVAGNQRKGTVHVDVKQTSSRKYEYRFIFVELEGFPPRTIIIEDNR